MQTIAAIFLLIIVIFLIKQGNKFIHYQSNQSRPVEQDWLEELRNIQSIKIKVIPANEIYRYMLGFYLMFLAYCIGAAATFCLETSITALFTHSKGIFNVPSIIGVAVLIGLLYTIFTLPVLWRYTFFKKAIAPNLKYGAFLVEKIKKIGRNFFLTLFVFVFIASAIPIHSKAGDEFFGLIFITAFVSFIVVGLGFGFFIGWEIERLGLPNLLEGIKQLAKKNKYSNDSDYKNDI